MELKDLDFKIVYIDVDFKNGSKAIYKLLVDDDNLIHDYKVEFSKIYFQNSTTDAHFKNKKNQIPFKLRCDICKLLKIEHLHGDRKRKKAPLEISNLNMKQINDLLEDRWHCQTFQNIIYLLTGSNASGEGKNPNAAEAYVIENGSKKAIGLLLQALFIKGDSNYEEYWNNTQETLNFFEWMKRDGYLYEKFNEFNTFNNITFEWKKHKQQLKNYFSKYKVKLRKFDELVANKRSKLNLLKSTSMRNFWGDQNMNNSSCEIAHIYPVKEIKKDAKKKLDIIKTAIEKYNEWLDPICDSSNCFPLTPNIHTDYDKYKYYWNTEGQIKYIIKDKTLLPSDIKYFEKIPENVLSERIHYLKKYEQYLRKLKKINV